MRLYLDHQRSTVLYAITFDVTASKRTPDRCEKSRLGATKISHDDQLFGFGRVLRGGKKFLSDDGSPPRLTQRIIRVGANSHCINQDQRRILECVRWRN